MFEELDTVMVFVFQKQGVAYWGKKTAAARKASASFRFRMTVQRDCRELSECGRLGMTCETVALMFLRRKTNE